MHTILLFLTNIYNVIKIAYNYIYNFKSKIIYRYNLIKKGDLK